MGLVFCKIELKQVATVERMTALDRCFLFHGLNFQLSFTEMTVSANEK
ncbi:MAG: hypothetical protein IJQ50_03835 [Clostridia bacterium]|nr:hypothetical protein [Clostridia bacterium]